MVSFFVIRCALVAALAGVAAGRPAWAAQAAAAPAPSAPVAQVRLALELTRTDTNNGAASVAPPARTVAAPTLSAFSRSSGSVQIRGDDLSYGVSVSPEVERDGRIAVLWTMQLAGKTLPGATSVNVAGGARVQAGKREPIAEISLRDPKTGRASLFRVFVTATTGSDAAPAPAR